MKSQQKLITQYRPYFLPAGMIIFSCLSLVFIILPMMQRTSQLFQDIGDLTNKVETLRKKVTFLEGLDETDLQNKFDLVASAIPIDNNVPNILATMQGLSNTSGMTLQSLTIDSSTDISTGSGNISTAKTGERPSTVDFTAELSGNQDQFFTLLKSTNTLRRLVKEKFFSVNFYADSTTRTTMTMNAYYASLLNTQQFGSVDRLTTKDLDTLSTLSSYEDFSGTTQQPDTVIIPTENNKENPFSQ